MTGKSKITRRLAIAAVSLAAASVAGVWLAGGIGAAAPQPAQDSSASGRRIETLSGGAALLDAGENAAAVRYFETALAGTPGIVELAEGLVEARSRLCARDSALAYLERTLPTVPTDRAESFGAYLKGAAARLGRNFRDASFYFAAAAEAAEKGRDPLSAAVCRGAMARCLLDAQDAGAALEAARKASSLAARYPSASRLLLEAAALEAACLGAVDSLAAADSLYRTTLDGAREKKFARVECASLTGLGRLEDKRQRDGEALAFYGRALVLARAMGSAEEIAALLNNRGQVEVRTGALAAAAGHFKQAEESARKCGLDWMLGYVYYGLGALAEKEGDRDKALKLFQQSLALHREHANAWGELGAHLRLGNLRSMQGEYPRAAKHLEYALAAYEKMGSLYGTSWALGGLALIHHKLGDFGKAEEYYRKTLEVRRRIGDRKGAAWCLNSLGMIADMQGRYREALSFEHEAMAIYEEIGDRSGVGEARYSIGSVYFYLGNYGEALKHYDRAFALANETGNQALLGNVVSGMGSVYSAAGRLDLAEGLYRKCLELARVSKEKTDVIWALNNLASLFIERGEPAAARGALEEALATLPPKGQDYMRARTLYLLGKSGGSAASSVGYFERALSLSEANGLEELKWKCLTDLAELYLAQGDTAKSYSTQHRAIVSVESLRRLAGTDELRRHILQPAILPYERIVSLVLARTGGRADVQEAFSYTERSRAQILASLLREAMERSGTRGNERLLERERELISKLTFYQARLQDSSLSPEERSGLLEKIEGVERRFLTLSIRLEEGDKIYVEALYPKVEQSEELLSALAPGECMLSYFLGERESHLFCGTDTTLRAYPLPARSVIEEKVGYFLSLLRQRAEAGEGAPADSGTIARPIAIPPQVIESASRELFDLLLGPAAKDLGGGERLVVIPDGPLNGLPFALLRDGEGYLVRNHDIAYAPSLRTLRYLRERNGIRERAKRVPIRQIIAVGASGEGPEGASRGSRVYPFTDIPIEPLPNAAHEARDVAALFARSLVLTGRGASEEAFKGSPLDDTGVLHIAAHAYIDNDDIRRSFIVLNPDRGFGDSLATAAEDGLLQWHEIAALRLNAALVTLSACRSAGGVLSAGEGISGLTQAFLYAGGGCVLAAQLDVPDDFTGAMMGEVYRNVRKGQSAAAALSAAQRAMLAKGGASSEPAVWGAFVAIGDGASAPRLEREFSRETYLAFALLAVAAVLVALNLLKRPR